MHSYGIKIPKTSKHAIQLDEQNGTILWRLPWEKDIKNVQFAFDVKDQGGFAPVGCQEIGCNPIFDIKATMLTWNVCFVAGGHTMNIPAAIMYASVVSR